MQTCATNQVGDEKKRDFYRKSLLERGFKKPFPTRKYGILESITTTTTWRTTLYRLKVQISTFRKVQQFNVFIT